MTTGYYIPVAILPGSSATRATWDDVATVLDNGFFRNLIGTDRLRVFNGTTYISGGSGALWVLGGITYTSGLIAGDYLTNKVTQPQFNSVVLGGQSNLNSGLYCTIAGGKLSQISSSVDYGFIGGGYTNILLGDDGVICGGINNTVKSTDSSIVGGYNNLINSNSVRAVIVGGATNSIQGTAANAANYGIICGGQDNSITGLTSSDVFCMVGGGSTNVINNAGYSSLIGGQINSINSCNWSFIGGGLSNLIVNSEYGSILGGRLNVITGDTKQYQSIVGGLRNTSSGFYSSCGGGADNRSIGSYNYTFGDTILITGRNCFGFGELNTITGNYNIVGGSTNKVFGNYSSIGGGLSNTSSGDYIFIGGGNVNVVKENFSTIAGGSLNLIAAGGLYSTVGGGQNNKITGFYACIPGGNNNLASGNNSFSAGTCSEANHLGAFIFSDSRINAKRSMDQDSITFHFQRGAFFSGTDIRTSGANIYVNGDIITTAPSAPTVTYKSPGILFSTCDATGNAALNVDTKLKYYNLPANTLNDNGDRLVIRSAGSIASASTVTVAFGGKPMINALPVGSISDWKTEIELIRSGSSTIRYNYSFDSVEKDYKSSFLNTQALNVNQLITISGNGAAADAFKADSMTVEFWPA